MKKITLFLSVVLSFFLLFGSSATAEDSNDFNWGGNSVEDSMKKFSNGFRGVGDGVIGVVHPVFKDSVNPDLGYFVGGIPHGAFSGAVSVLGSNGGKIVHGFGNMVGGAVGWIPVAGPVVSTVTDMVFGSIGNVFNWFGDMVGGFTSKMHPSSPSS